MQQVEIEKKFRVIKLPDNVENYKKIEIEQAYLNYGCTPTLRLRRYNNNEYILSYKLRKKECRSDLSVCDEVNFLYLRKHTIS